MNDCLFCKIIKGEIPCAKIYEDEYAIAFLDIRPATRQGGHTLVVPKKHFELITEMDEQTLAKTMLAVKKVSEALLKISEGVNILQNNKRIAGQLIPHVHFHLIPRYKEDGLRIAHWAEHEYKQKEMEKVLGEIKAKL